MAKTNLSKLQENFTCLAIVCVDHIKLPLMDILENHIKPPDLYYEINSSTLISANKLRPDQKKLCYITPPGVPDYSKFDVTLLYTLLRNLCPSLKPSGRWGEEPAASHTQLGDDIERLRLFRNEQFAHANSAEISDGEFNKLWKDLQTVINRIQNNKKAGCKTDYLQTFKSIEKRLLNWDDLEKYKLLLEATIHASKQREEKDGPDIRIEGTEKAVCGSTAHFQANFKERKVSFLSVNWKKLIKNESTPIDTSNKKFWSKTNKELFIESVCKEDEGEYQAVLSFEEDRIGTTIKSNVIFLRVVGGIPTVTTSHETCLQTHSVKLIGNVFVIDDLPVIDEIYWTKNGNKIDTQVYEGKYSKVSVDVPSLTIYNVNQYDAGHYTLTATNAAGTTVSDAIVLGAPEIVLEECEEGSDGCQIFPVIIKSIPTAYNVQWQVANKQNETLTPLDENAEEYRGTTNSIPHSVLVVRRKEQLKNNTYQIKVQNFIGVGIKEISTAENQKLKMVYPKMLKEEEEFQLLHKASCLPRYTYHWSLVDWYMEGLPKDIIFTRYRLESCLIIIGGIITDEEKKVLFGESALSERQNVRGLQKEAENYTAFLIVYFFNGDLTKMGEDIEKLDRILPLKDGHGHVLVVMEMKYSCDRKIIIEEIRTIGITKVEVVMKTRSIIVQNITCILEQMLSSYLVGTKKTLLDHSHTHRVDSSLLEVNAILKRLKQAKCYPEPLAETVEPDKNEINNILQRFPEKIIYSVQDGNRLYIIASDQATKMSLETLLSGSGFQNISCVVTVEDKLPISELSKTGVPLHGAKFVYVNLGKEAFNTDECFATTGSLMQVNNNSLMVAVTCRHALEKEDHFYTLIENSVVRLGEEVKQPNNNMERLHDDISVVRIDDTTRSIVDEKCEKLLIDTSKCPSPARISDRTLVKGDIVHKRGARTGLTTGIVKDVRTQKIGRFSEQSSVIFITGRDSIPFAEKGDSGSLVFQHSLDPEEKRLDVLAMVQGKVNVPIPNADVICFPFIKGCENLQSHIPDIQNLDFFNH